MARIRSIHPGLFTDEAFVTLSPIARVLLMGIWTEADDHGVFDWKPLTLKMRVLPADNEDVAALLEELESADAIKKVEIAGKSCGLVRNFSRFQRPKKPTYRVDLPNEFWNYVGLKADGSVPHSQSSPTGTEPVGKQKRTPSETRPQRKEEGGSRRGKEDLPNNIDRSVVVVLPERSTTTTTEGHENRFEGKPDTPLPPDWQPNEAGIEFAHSQGMTDATLDEQIVSFKAYNHGQGTMCPDWAAYWQRWCIKWKERQAKPAKAAPRVEVNTAPDWDGYASRFARGLGWPKGVGPDPDSAACRCPPEILAKHGLAKAKVQA